MIPSDPIKWGIIGCGNVCEKKSGPAFYKIPHSQLYAVMRRDLLKAADFAQRHHVSVYSSDAEELIHDKHIHAIYVATPPSSHAEYAIKAMKAGKAVYVEKPMARTYTECLDMIAVQEETKSPLFVAYYRRALPYFLKVKEILDRKVLGTLEKIDLQLIKQARKEDTDPHHLPWRLTPEISGGGYFYDLASHQLDILDFYFGKAELLTSKVLNLKSYYEAEDYVETELVYGESIHFYGKWFFAADKSDERDRCIITGSNGSLAFSTFSQEAIELNIKGEKNMYRLNAPEHIQMPFIEQIVNELLGNGKANSCLESAAHVNYLLQEIVSPYYTIDKA
jgi:1,5-anhydro-D-fructose reductase (1,5-anhydro-D-mannitol-forming)